ncbi:hypothetical protein HKBW3S42_01286, partial [Candidatus Hakubella thermalkaliphila]
MGKGSKLSVNPVATRKCGVPGG